MGSPLRTLVSLDPDEIDRLATESEPPQTPEKRDDLPTPGRATGKEAGRGE